ncbi:MAG: 5-methyltetrahydropteroyltriglutamate--homocysteine S-methyltransferase [Hyphomicrobiales bacterium]|nr:5-methyltetrahydropteroyltriglutamate--homocysteine S-methyltransferase [Hyphomicrobiales bacterium]
MSARSTPPFRADQVGSLIRPDNVRQARKDFEAGKITEEALKTLQREAIPGVVKLQEDIGFKAVTDGEYNRGGWQRDFLLGFENVKLVPSKVPVRFHKADGVALQQPPTMAITGKLSRRKPIFVEDFKFLKSVVGPKTTPKITIPSPTLLHFRGGRDAIDSVAYPTIEEFYADLARVYREEIADLAAEGCRYLQIDETNLAYLCDPALRAHAASLGEDPDQLLRTYAKLLNDTMSGKPDDMVICIHLCRGNYGGAWVAEGGYEPVAEQLLSTINANGYFMEYDSDRAGGFEPLRFLPKGKTVVLGLITTKNGALETKDQIKRRIDEAAKVVPLDQLALSPQCGFASGIEGMAMTIDQEIAKLKLVVETARDVWGD